MNPADLIAFLNVLNFLVYCFKFSQFSLTMFHYQLLALPTLLSRYYHADLFNFVLPIFFCHFSRQSGRVVSFEVPPRSRIIGAVLRQSSCSLRSDWTEAWP